MHQWLTRVTCNSWVTLKRERNAPPLGAAYPFSASCSLCLQLSVCYPSLNVSVPRIRFSYKSVPVSVCLCVCCCCVMVCVRMCDCCCLYLRGFCSVFIEQHRNNRMGKEYDRLQNSLASSTIDCHRLQNTQITQTETSLFIHHYTYMPTFNFSDG